MQTHRQSQVPRPKHLPLQHLALLLVVGLVPIQIKSYLPYPDITGRRVEQLFLHNGQFGLEVIRHRGGVQPHHLAEILWVFGGQSLLTAMGGAVDAGQQHGVHPSGNSPLHRLAAVNVESFVIEMAMRVNHA